MPLGLSSNDALIRAKRLYLAKRRGIRERSIRSRRGFCRSVSARRRSSRKDLLEADKTYEATMRLGIRTTTGDAEGEALESRDVTCDEAAVSGVAREVSR